MTINIALLFLVCLHAISASPLQYGAGGAAAVVAAPASVAPAVGAVTAIPAGTPVPAAAGPTPAPVVAPTPAPVVAPTPAPFVAPAPVAAAPLPGCQNNLQPVFAAPANAFGGPGFGGPGLGGPGLGGPGFGGPGFGGPLGFPVAPLPGTPPMVFPGRPQPAAPTPINPALAGRIAPRLAEMDASYAANDPQRFAAVFGDKAIVMPLSNMPYHNHTGIQNYLKYMHASGYTSIHHPTIFDAMQSGNLVWARTSYVEAKAGAPVNYGEAMYVFEDVNGQLFVRYATYTNDMATGKDVSDPLGDAPAKTKVMARLAELEKAYEAGNIEAVSQMFDEKAKILPDTYTVFGQEGARLYFQTKHDKGITRVVYSVVEAKQAADWINARIFWRAYKGDEFVKEGKALLVLQDVGGQLMIHYLDTDHDFIASEHPGLESDVRELWRNWEKYYKAGDWASLTALYTPDGMEIPPTAEIAMGAPALTAYFAPGLAKVPWFYGEIVEVTQAGNYAVSYGVFHNADAAGVVSAEGTFLTVYKLEGGKPKILWDSYNYN